MTGDLSCASRRPLRELTTKIGSGSTPKGGDKSYPRSGVPFIRSMNVLMRQFTWDGMAHIDRATHEAMKGTHVQPNDVLLNITGASLGRVACAPADLKEANVNQHVVIIRPKPELVPQYLMYWLSQPVVQSLINNQQKGFSRQGYTKAQIEALEIPVPSPPEQRRVIARIEGLTTQLNGARRLHREAMHEAAVYMRSTYASVYRRLLSQCDVVPLGQTGTACGGGTPSKSKPEYWSGVIPWVAPKYMKNSHIGDSPDHISEAALETCSARLIPSPAVLFVVRGMILVRNVPVAVSKRPLVINQDMKAIVPKDGIDAEFLAAMMRGAEDVLLGLVDVAGHGTRKLQTERWAGVPIPLPPPPEQQRIVATLEASRANAERLAAIQAKIAAELESFTPALLAKAFRGEL